MCLLSVIWESSLGKLDCIQYVSDNDLCIDHLQRTEAEDIVEEIKIMLLISTMNVGRKKHIRPSQRYIDILIQNSHRIMEKSHHSDRPRPRRIPDAKFFFPKSSDRVII